MKPSISVITPAYNRAYILHMAYESLKQQTYKNFEWVITDDGSTDNTGELVDKWIKENQIKIKYIYQQNGGMSKALNTCIEHAEMELCSKLDSDDFLESNALEKLANLWSENRADCYCGILSRRSVAATGQISGSKPFPRNVKSATLENLYNRYGLSKDTELFVTYVTKIVKKYPFPIIEGEKRIPTAWLAAKLAIEGYKFLLIDEPIYIWNPLQDGITSNMNQKKNLINNFKSSVIYYKQFTHPVFTLKTRLKSMAFYIYLLLNDKKNILYIYKSVEYHILFIVAFPLILYLFKKFGRLK